MSNNNSDTAASTRRIVATERTALLMLSSNNDHDEETTRDKRFFVVVVDCWDSYVSALERNPIVVKSLTAFVILAAADALGQAVELCRATTSNHALDVLRMARFGLLGLLGTPFVHYYYHVLDETLPPTPQPWTRRTFFKLFIDQGIQAPVVTIFIFVFVGLLEGKGWNDLRLQLKHDYLSTMIANWKLFIPSQLINMAFCPPPLRVLFINVVFFFWSIILSVILHKKDTPQQDDSL